MGSIPVQDTLKKNNNKINKIKFSPLVCHLLSYSSFFGSCLAYFVFQKVLCVHIIGVNPPVTFWGSTFFISFKTLITVWNYFGYLFPCFTANYPLLSTINSVFSRSRVFLFNLCPWYLAQHPAHKSTQHIIVEWMSLKSFDEESWLCLRVCVVMVKLKKVLLAECLSSTQMYYVDTEPPM